MARMAFIAVDVIESDAEVNRAFAFRAGSLVGGLVGDDATGACADNYANGNAGDRCGAGDADGGTDGAANNGDGDANA